MSDDAEPAVAKKVPAVGHAVDHAVQPAPCPSVSKPEALHVPLGHALCAATSCGAPRTAAARAAATRDSGGGGCRRGRGRAGCGARVIGDEGEWPLRRWGPRTNAASYAFLSSPPELSVRVFNKPVYSRQPDVFPAEGRDGVLWALLFPRTSWGLGGHRVSRDGVTNSQSSESNT